MRRSKVTMYEGGCLLYEELVCEILSYLPVQSLFRFKTVCKSWNNIISSPSFAKLHLKNYCNNTTTTNSDGLFVRLWLDTITNKWRVSMTSTLSKKSREICLSVDMEASSPFLGSDKARITGPAKGLICIYGMPPPCGIALCNPILGKTEVIPSCPISDPSFKMVGMIVRSIALGIDQKTKDVKIVQLLSYLLKKNNAVAEAIRADVYTRRTRTWRRLEDVPDAFVRRCGVHMDGSSFTHWLDLGGHLLVSLDMDKEVFYRTMLPTTFDRKRYKTQVFPRGETSLVLLSCPRQHLQKGDGFLFHRWELVGGLGSQGRWTRLSPVNIRPDPLWDSGLLLNKDHKDQEEIENRLLRSRSRCHLRVIKYKGSLVFY